MKIAAVLTTSALLLIPGMALAQTATGAAPDRSVPAGAAKPAHGNAANFVRAPRDSDRAIDAELRRIDRMMTICTGC